MKFIPHLVWLVGAVVLLFAFGRYSGASMPCQDPTPELLGVRQSPPTNGAMSVAELQGTWEGFMAGHEKDGKITITIAGDLLHFHRDTNFWFETAFTLPAGKDPQQLHATIKRAPASDTNSIGKVVFAIFKIEDETLILAGEQASEAEPPKMFPAAASEGPAFRYDLKKVQPQKEKTRMPNTK